MNTNERSEDITWWSEGDTNFIFSWKKQYVFATRK